jgi:exopolyphosphatase/guanosine-5'-triphosphate,3'-diphosphate pyrophosphatase
VSRPGERLAAIDVGSNTILLSIAIYSTETGFELLKEDEDQPRLSAGLSETGRLSEAAMRRALETLGRMLETCRADGVRRISAVATAAVREASNGGEFARRAQNLGIPLRIISPETEAALSYRSASYRFPGTDRMLVADIGGGSLELIGAAAGTVRVALSLPLGAVRLTELRMSGENLQRHIQEALSAVISADRWRDAMVIGSGGTFATLASMVLARRGEKRDGIHGTSIALDDVGQLLETLTGMSLEERRKVPGLRSERADIIVAGLTVVVELLKALGTSPLTVSGFGLRDGLLLEMAGLGAGS